MKYEISSPVKQGFYRIRRNKLRASGRWLVACGSCLGLLTVFLSSQYAAGFKLRESPLPFQYPATVLMVFAATGFVFMLAVVVEPRLYWPLLIGSATATCGMYVLGFPIFDEWLAGCITAGGMIAVMTGRVPPRRWHFERWWVKLFLLFSCVLFIQSITGLVVYQNPKALRFTLDYAVIFCTALLLAKFQFPQPDTRAITRLVAWSGTFYLMLYLIHGYVFRDLVYIYNMDGIGGAGAAYANFALVVAIPAAILLLCYESGRRRFGGWLTIAGACWVSVLGDSRAGFLGILLPIALVPFVLGWRQAIGALLGPLVLITLVGLFMWSNPYYVLNVLGEIQETFQVQVGSESMNYLGRDVEFSKGDTARVYLVLGAINTVLDNPGIFMFGAGTYGFWPNAEPYVERWRRSFDAPSSVVNYGSALGGGPVERPRPPAWPAMIVESGLIGLSLFVANFLSAAWAAIIRKSKNGPTLIVSPRLLIAATLLSAFAWGAFAEIQDNMLLYLLLMPFGLVDCWTRDWDFAATRKSMRRIGLPKTRQRRLVHLEATRLRAYTDEPFLLADRNWKDFKLRFRNGCWLSEKA